MRGYKCIFVMPDKMSQEKIANLRAFGAQGRRLPHGRRCRRPAQLLQGRRAASRDETPNCFYANQYHNPANPEAHYLSSAPEIWQQTGGDFDVFVAGMGTGGTHQRHAASSSRRRSRRSRSSASIRSGRSTTTSSRRGRITKPFSYKVEGIGEDFFPTTMNLKIIDEIVRVDDKECFL